MRFVAAIILCALIQTPCPAEDTPIGKGLAYLDVHRLVHRFDFEEEKLGNHEDMPMHWFRIARQGYTRYSHMSFDTTQKVSDQHSFMLQPNGGSVGAVLEPGVLAAMPGADYLVIARVRTDQLQHARAMISGHFLDAQRNIIPASIARTAMTVSNGKWTTISMRLDGLHPKAAWIVLGMQVVQPDQFPADYKQAKLSPNQLEYRDIHATVWFDDLAIYQLPRIELSTHFPTNLITQDDQPTLVAIVRDLTGNNLQSRLDVYDHMGRRVDCLEHHNTLTNQPQWNWKPNLPKFGWYWAELNVRSKRGLVGRRQVCFCYLPKPLPINYPDSDRFVLVAENIDDEHRPLLVPVLEKTSGSALVVSAWKTMIVGPAAGDEPQPDPLMRDLALSPNDLTLCFNYVPDDLADKTSTDVDDPLDLMTRPYEQWRKDFETLLIRYGRTVDRWQIGASGSGLAFWRDDLPALYTQAYGYIHQYIPRPKVGLAWSAFQQVTTQVDDLNALSMHLPCAIAPQRIPDYAKTWPTDKVEITLNIQTLPSGPYNHEQRAEDLVMRMLYAWQTPIQRLAIDSPWMAEQDHTPYLMPDPMLAVWSNTAAQLAGRRVVGQINMGQGLRCLVLDGPGGGALVCWNHNAPPQQATFAMYLGDKPMQIDLWGNRTPVPVDDQGRHVLKLTSMPVFIDGIDVMIARLRSSFKIDPAFVRSVYKVHHHTLVFTNPYPRTIHGRLRITELTHWKINPRVFNFSAQSGQTLSLPIELNFPLSELAGQKMFTVEMEMSDESSRPIRLMTPLVLGLKNVQYSPTVYIEPSEKGGGGGGDVVVTALITNLSDKPQSFYAFAVLPDQPRIERIVTQLAPGQTILKRFRYVNLADQASGQTIRTGLRELDGPAILNTTVQVP